MEVSVRRTSNRSQQRLFRKVSIADLEVLGVALQLRLTQENAQKAAFSVNDVRQIKIDGAE